ncbi:MAG: radical SAM protein [bacterium]|nr:radical SAM protein [bacterium]
MEKVDVKFGFLCNNKCRFCVQGNKRELYGDIPFHEVIATMETARERSDSIVFTGGEVTIKKDFLIVLEKARELGFSKIQIQSNGRMFASKEFCRETIAAGATEFALALHGFSPELHDFLTLADGSFYETASGIKNLKELEQYVGTNSVITRYNYTTLPKLAGLLVYLGVDQYQFAFVHAIGTAGENFEDVVPRYCKIEPYVKEGLSLGIKAGKVVMTEAIPYCFMSGYTGYIAENIMPSTAVFDKNFVVDDYKKYRLTEGKSKGAQCKECACNDACEGPWVEYPEHFGWDEFVPVQ